MCELTTAQLKYDNFGGRWGETTKLDGFLQAYACEKAKIEARRQGHSVVEQPPADDSIKLIEKNLSEPFYEMDDGRRDGGTGY